jgi:hypothetical protein
MERTGCHIHFPDNTNTRGRREKKVGGQQRPPPVAGFGGNNGVRTTTTSFTTADQVSIAGLAASVDGARAELRVRKYTEIIYILY